MSTTLFEQLPLDRLLKANELCNRFESALQNGEPVHIDEFLTEVLEEDRPILRMELEGILNDQKDTAPKQAPRKVGDYELEAELGRGGMGVVYRARQLRPNRVVALKMISAGAHAGARELERFRSEADAIAQLQHANIVQVYEVGEHDCCPYFALEYVAGGSLDRYLQGTPQPPQIAAQFVERLAHAIHHAHQRGVIHRDLKPANVLLQIADCRLQIGEGKQALDEMTPTQSAISDLQSAIPKITDFGLAKLLGVNASSATQSGDLVGTPSYMAPEQVGECNAAISAATDVYGLGAILYELLTGRPPFRGATALETILQVQSVEPVSPSRLQPKCPRDLVTICLKCLSKQPRQRYVSALELAEDLRRFLGGQPIRARPVGPLGQVLKWTRRQPVVASLAGLLLLAVAAGVGAGSWFWRKAEVGLQTTAAALQTAEGALTKERIALVNERAALDRERTATAARIATLDRFQVALAHREWQANNFRRTVELLDACTEEQRQGWEWRYLDRLRHSGQPPFPGHSNTVRALAMHPSGRKVFSASHDWSVRCWDLETGRGTILGNHQSLAVAVACSPDGRLLASSGSGKGQIKLWDAQTGAALGEFAFGGQGVVTVWGLAFDSSSRYLALGARQRVKVRDTHDKKWVYDRVVDTDSIAQVAFSPDGQYLATASVKVKVWNWTAKGNQPVHNWPGHKAGTNDLAFSPDGNLLASGGRDGLIRVRSLKTGKEAFTLNAHQLSVTSVCFSPDGERLASAGQEGDMHVWSVKDRRRLFTLHGHSGAVTDLIYTPNGDRLVSAGADFLVRVWDAAASQEVVTLPVRAAPNEVCALAYGPGGRFFAWGDITGHAGIWDTQLAKEILRLDDPKLTSRNPITAFAFSPNGRQVAWCQKSGATRLWDLDRIQELPLAGAKIGNILGLAFSGDNGQLLAASLLQGKLRLHELRTGQELLTLPRPLTSVTHLVWSPDARRFVTLEDRKHARLWATDTGQLQGELEHEPQATCITFSADGKFLALGGVGGKMSVWDLTTNRQTMSVKGHSSNLFGLALSPDGRRLASAASDFTVKLWDTQAGHEVLALRTQLHEHSPLAFSPDGEDLASVNMDNQLQHWSARHFRWPP